MSLINKEIGNFKVQAFQKGEFKTVKKEDVLGKWSVFFFYPADFTFVCPTELEDLANKYAEFQAAGCEIYSVSTDTHFVHKAWHDASDRIKKIDYVMLADPTHVLSKDFEVYIEEDGLAERGSFIVNPEGKSGRRTGRPHRSPLSGEGQISGTCTGKGTFWRTDYDHLRSSQLSGRGKDQWSRVDGDDASPGTEFRSRISAGRGNRFCTGWGRENSPYKQGGYPLFWRTHSNGSAPTYGRF